MYSRETLFTLVDVLGVLIGAITGTLVGHRLGYDITGSCSLAPVFGLGGGVIRDVCLQDGPRSH